MKTILKTLLTLLCLCALAFGQAPESLNYQAVARDANGNPLTNQSISLRMSVLSGSANGSLVFEELHTASTNSLGLFTLKIGQGTVTSGTFATIDWGTISHFLKVELDVNGGQSFTLMGTSQLLSVPYALHAKTATTVTNDQVDDADNDPTNEYNSSASLSGTTLSLTDGGGTLTVGLSSLQDGVNDADADPQNELQTLSKSGSTLTLSNGGGSITDEVDDNDWVFSGNNMYSGVTGNVGIGITNPDDNLCVLDDIRVKNSSNANKIRLDVIGGGDVGFLETYGQNGNRNFRVTNLTGNENLGVAGVYNDAGSQRVAMATGSGGTGLHWTYGANGNLNTYLNFLSGYSNNGYIGIHDANGSIQAGMYVSSSGQGIVFGDVKNFRMDHPTQPGKEIWYASLEGPEAGAYTRGTGTLVNGRATITFPDHFQLVANETTMTVIVTPLSGASKGMAVITKSANGFEVQELMSGTGSYEFDWEVKAVRKGYENYRVIRDADEIRPGGLDAEGFAPRGADD